MDQGPQLTSLTHRLSQAPQAVTAAPWVVSQDQGIVSTAAMLSDLLLALGGLALSEPTSRAMLDYYTASRGNLLRVVQLACYVCRDDWFVRYSRTAAGGGLAARAATMAAEGFNGLSQHATADYLFGDPEGREELCRRILMGLDLLPQGETESQAADRLAALDSVERARVIEQTRAAQRRAREIREAMARKAAEEAASKMTRE
jgi:hypothetical protein